jgi:hypothetical protein
MVASVVVGKTLYTIFYLLACGFSFVPFRLAQVHHLRR